MRKRQLELCRIPDFTLMFKELLISMPSWVQPTFCVLFQIPKRDHPPVLHGPDLVVLVWNAYQIHFSDDVIDFRVVLHNFDRPLREVIGINTFASVHQLWSSKHPERPVAAIEAQCGVVLREGKRHQVRGHRH